MEWNSRQTRRGVLKVAFTGVPLALLSACQATVPAPSGGAAPSSTGTGAPTAAPAQSPASPPAQAPAAGSSSDLDQLVAAAKQEGKLSLILPPGDPYRNFTNVFQDKFGIQVELMVGNGNADIVPKIQAERTGGQYNWDAITHSPGGQLVGLMPMGAQDPLGPTLFLPDVLDDSKWAKGFQAGWTDLKQTYCYDFVAGAQPSARVNRAFVPESQLSTLDQLWDPQWKGKIAMFDPRIGGSGLQAATLWLLTLGEDRLHDFLANQQPALTQDRRQIGEWVVRGEYPIAIGSSIDSFLPLAAQGADTSQIQTLDPTNINGIIFSTGTGTVGLMNRAPHPNAAKLYVNWLLTQEGQSQWDSLTGYNSRRTDVAPGDPSSTLDPTQNYVFIDSEANYGARDKATALAKELLTG